METKTAAAAAGRPAGAGFAAAAGPAFLDVARHAFKLYDDDGRVYCVSCDRVLAAATAAHLETHYRTCDRGASGATGGARTYACGACDVTTGDPDQWAHHLGTAGHWRRCAGASRSAARRPRYAYACAECDVTLYDTEDGIERHASREHRGAGADIPEDDRFVAVVYAALAASRAGGGGGGGGGEDAVHCCVGCYAVDARPVHAELRPRCGGGGGPAETFYCRTCRVTIVCDAPTYDRLHRAAPEHAAMAAAAARDEDDEDGDDSRTVPRMARTLVLGTRRRLGGDDDDGHCRECRLCGDPLPSRPDAVSQHVSRCPALLAQGPRREWPTLPPPPAGKSRADYDAFRCGVCRVTVADPVAWSRHLSSAVAAHAVTPHRMAARAYHECAPCRTLYYGPRDDADGSRCGDGSEHRFRPVGAVADLMLYVYRDVNSAAADDDVDNNDVDNDDVDNNDVDNDDVDNDDVDNNDDDGGSSFGDDRGSSYGSCSRRRRHNYHYYYVQNTGRYGRCDRSAEPAAVPFHCPTCRLEFYGDRAAFRQHALTAEHVLVRLFTTARPTARARHVITPVHEYVPAHVTDGDGRSAASDVGSPGVDAVTTIRDGGRGHAFPWPDGQEPREPFDPDRSS